MSYFKRRWFESRSGYVYMAFVLNIGNFILIMYVFQFLPTPLQELPTWLFALIVVIIVIPLTIGLGRLHLYNQYHTDVQISLEQNPYSYKFVKNSKEQIIAKAQLDLLTALKHVLNKDFTYDFNNVIEDDIKKLKLLIDGIDSRQIK